MHFVLNFKKLLLQQCCRPTHNIKVGIKIFAAPSIKNCDVFCPTFATFIKNFTTRIKLVVYTYFISNIFQTFYWDKNYYSLINLKSTKILI